MSAWNSSFGGGVAWSCHSIINQFSKELNKH